MLYLQRGVMPEAGATTIENAVIVVPCFNEAKRLSAAGFHELMNSGRLSLLFVDDGSIDATCERLQQITAGTGGKTGILRLEQNTGKAEAVRRGMVAAISEGAELVGFTDADLSTPASEVLRLVEELRDKADKGVKVVMGSRVLLLGTDIRRRALRHYLGRVFATCASIALDLKVYDTQCGAKVFRVTPVLRQALSSPFTSRWAFDVELIARLLAPTTDGHYTADDFVEVPLQCWHDVRGSKVTLLGGVRAFGDLARIMLTRLRSVRRP